MFIRYYVVVGRPFAEVEPEISTRAAHWLLGLSEEAAGGEVKLLAELGFNVAKRRIAKPVEVVLGEPRRTEGVTLVPIRWQAQTQVGLFPALDGQLEVASLGSRLTQVGLSASYEPPLGLIGKIADRALMHRVAEATVRDLMDRVGVQLSRPVVRA